jgi:hypothetical protein
LGFKSDNCPSKKCHSDSLSGYFDRTALSSNLKELSDMQRKASEIAEISNNLNFI